MTYKQEPEESLDDFVNRSRRMTKRCSLTEHEQQQRIIELLIAGTPIEYFQKELLRKEKNSNPVRNCRYRQNIRSFQHSYLTTEGYGQ